VILATEARKVSRRVPSGRELEILKILWDAGPASVRQVHQRMCPAGELAYNTVQTLLRIMDDKGLVTHVRRGRTFVYRPKHTRDREMSRLLERVFDGALDQFVASLLRSKSISTGELKKIERIIADARRKQAERSQKAS
jgi:predicted transcriptional regulator